MAIPPPKTNTIKYTDRDTLSKIYIDHLAKIRSKSGASGSYSSNSPSGISGEVTFVVTKYPTRKYNSSGFLFPSSFVRTLATAYANSASPSPRNHFTAISNYMGLDRNIPVIPAASTNQTPVWLAMNDGVLEVYPDDEEFPLIPVNPDGLPSDLPENCCKLPSPSPVLNEDGTPILPLNPECDPEYNMNPFHPVDNPSGYVGTTVLCNYSVSRTIIINGREVGSNSYFGEDFENEKTGDWDYLFDGTDTCEAVLPKDAVVGGKVSTSTKQHCFDIRIPRFSLLLPAWGLDPRDFPVNPDGSITLEICIVVSYFCDLVICHYFGSGPRDWVYNPELGIWEYIRNNKVAHPKVNDCPTCDDLATPIEPSQWINTIGNGPETTQPGNYNNIGSGGCLNC